MATFQSLKSRVENWEQTICADLEEVRAEMSATLQELDVLDEVYERIMGNRSKSYADDGEEEDLPWNGESSEEERQHDLQLEENFGAPTTSAPFHRPNLLRRRRRTSDTEVSTTDITGSESSSAMESDGNE